MTVKDKLVQKPRSLYLFNDMVMLVQPVKKMFRKRFQCEGFVPLESAQIVDIIDQESQVQHGFQVLPSDNPDASLTILCDSEGSKDQWMTDIFEASFILWEEDQMRVGKVVPPSSSSAAGS